MSKGKRGGFGGGGGFGGNMQQLMMQAKQMQSKMESVQKDLEQQIFEAQSGGGVIKVRINGKQELIALEIDPSTLDDKDMLQDMILAAVNEGIKAAKEASEQAMGGALGNLPIPPGLF